MEKRLISVVKKKCEIKNYGKEGIGVYWASNESKAIDYWGGHDDEYNLKGKVRLIGKINDLNTIDTLNTILSEIEYQRNEDEIRLYKDKEIEIIKIKYEDPEMDEPIVIEGNWKAFT